MTLLVTMILLPLILHSYILAWLFKPSRYNYGKLTTHKLALRFGLANLGLSIVLQTIGTMVGADCHQFVVDAFMWFGLAVLALFVFLFFYK